MKSGSIGIKEVASRAGVSIGTVSNVLNRPAFVSEPTRVKVRKAIEELGFVRNDTGRQLRAGQSRTIAYVMLDAANPFFTDVAKGIEEVSREHDVGLYLCDSGGDAGRQADYLELLLEQRVRGVLITPVEDDTSMLAPLRRQGVAVALLDRAGGSEWCSVGVDDVDGGALAVAHLAEQGHERIAFVGGPMTTPQVTDRLRGARKAMRRAGHVTDALVVVETGSLDVAEGRRAGERIAALARSRRPTAAFCANDLLALGLLQHTTQAGIDVPDELAIVGYDDIDFAAAAAVPLSSVRQPRQLLGRTAAQLLFAESDADEAHVHQQVVFRPELVTRTSSLDDAVRPARSRRRGASPRARPSRPSAPA